MTGQGFAEAVASGFEQIFRGAPNEMRSERSALQTRLIEEIFYQAVEPPLSNAPLRSQLGPEVGIRRIDIFKYCPDNRQRGPQFMRNTIEQHTMQFIRLLQQFFAFDGVPLVFTLDQKRNLGCNVFN